MTIENGHEWTPEAARLRLDTVLVAALCPTRSDAVALTLDQWLLLVGDLALDLQHALDRIAELEAKCKRGWIVHGVRHSDVRESQRRLYRTRTCVLCGASFTGVRSFVTTRQGSVCRSERLCAERTALGHGA